MKKTPIDFDSYERVKEPHKREKASNWRVAIGLQQVDGLEVSEYLKETAVFMIKYLRSCGFKVNNDIFAENSRYFRNLLPGENHELRNRYMLVYYGADEPSELHGILLESNKAEIPAHAKWFDDL